MLSDLDPLCPNSIETILGLLPKYQFGYLIINRALSCIYTGGHKKLYHFTFEITNQFSIFSDSLRIKLFQVFLKQVIKMSWTIEQKTFIVKTYFSPKFIRAAKLRPKERFQCRGYPNSCSIYKWFNKFRSHGL